jgi:hypothetical protein
VLVGYVGIFVRLYSLSYDAGYVFAHLQRDGIPEEQVRAILQLNRGIVHDWFAFDFPDPN